VQDITIRQMNFGFPDTIDPIVIAGKPEESYQMLGLSLLLPYLEPYLIRTMKRAHGAVTDPDLAAELMKFNGQEGQHFKQHIRFNDAFKAFGIGFERLEEFEAGLEQDYRRFSETRSLRWNLAYAEGFEALTTAVARASFEQGTDSDLHPAARDLFAWHLIEELEHRTVAFDVYDHVCGGYFYRLAVAAYAQWHMARWIAQVVRYMLGADERVLADHGGLEGRKARTREITARARRDVLPKFLETCSPWYTPHDIEMTAEMRAMARSYSELAVHTS